MNMKEYSLHVLIHVMEILLPLSYLLQLSPLRNNIVSTYNTLQIDSK